MTQANRTACTGNPAGSAPKSARAVGGIRNGQEGYNAKPDAHAAFPRLLLPHADPAGQPAPGGAKDYVVGGKMVGGFAFVAYPAEYGNSGVMTFMINQDGVLLQKDLGKNTTETASAMSEFNPDASWSIVQE